MKVVLFCGGLGLRIRDSEESLPKPMTMIGNRPILWHLMKYYAYYGVTDFVLCLGHKADLIKHYFVNYDEWISNDFVMSSGGATVEMMNRDIADWRITFVDTGLSANIGQRLMAVRPHLDGEDVFLANYADGLSDLHLPSYIAQSVESGKVATFLCAKPNLSLHAVTIEPDGSVDCIAPIAETGIRINSGFFVFRRQIFDYIQAGEELVEQPFARLIADRMLRGHSFDGFFGAMDTFKDKQQLEELYVSGRAPWQVWRTAIDGPTR
jgi:glucose-1-phosphate cytidylyltransferase